MSEQESEPSNQEPPQLPKGNSSILRGISENLSFHASPEAFIVSRIHQLQKHDPSALNSRTPIRAKILNRNVAVISSYDQIKAILNTMVDENDERPPLYIASSAYSQFMDQFFPPPNLLLSDGCPHRKMRSVWDEAMKSLHDRSSTRLRSMISSFWMADIPTSTPVDLYESMKKLSWRVLLDTFLGRTSDEDEDGLFEKVQSLQEDLLRGQFSLMPVSVNTGFWQSPRSKGVAARKKLQDLIAKRLRTLRDNRKDALEGGGRPESQSVGDADFSFESLELSERMEEVRDHVLMMTSSLAAKALASLLTAFLLNIYFFERGGINPFEELRMMKQNDQAENHARYLKSIYLETERLSPPIVGIMRRLTRDAVLKGWNGEVDTKVPAGWDAWLYFVGGGRDPVTFGNDCMDFDPIRYMSDDAAEPIAFSAGPKSCLGKDFIRDLVVLTAKCCLESGLTMTGNVPQAGVRAWLGWETANPEQWAAHMKQLPTQRPVDPVYVQFERE